MYRINPKCILFKDYNWGFQPDSHFSHVLDDKHIYTYQVNHIFIYLRYLLCTPPDDMKTIKKYFSFTEMGREKGQILIFHVICLNNGISISVSDIILKLCVLVLHILPEGSVYQIFH